MSILHIGGVNMSFKVTWKLHALCFFTALIICLITQKYISNLIINLLLENNLTEFTVSTIINLCVYLLVIFVFIAFIHERIHGFSYKLFGGNVKYRFKGLYACVYETSGIAVHRTKFLIVLLAPLTLISIASLFIPGSVGGVVFLLNLLGSTGDFMMAFYLCKSNENMYVIDKSYGFDVVDNL